MIGSYKFLKKVISLDFVDEVWLFGSRARDDNRERADIDIAIICPKATDAEWQKLVYIIESADTLLKVDCVRFDLLKEDKLKENILKQKKILYQKGTNYMDKSLWKDYFKALGSAVKRLEEVLTHKDINNIEYLRDAAIQRFEFTIELYWKVLKKFLAYEKMESTTPRDVISKAFQYKFIDDELIWLSMLDDRNNISHVYNIEDAQKIFVNIKNYYPVMEAIYQKLERKFEAY